MKIGIVSVGKKHDDIVKAGILEFEKRISAHHQVEWKIIPTSSKEEEGGNILEYIKGDDVVIVLDEKGLALSTKDFSEVLQKNLNQGIKRLLFVIGGAYGVSPDVISRANVALSLSKLTFPHQLVRLILVEQLYRALSILNNGKYHHE